MIVPTRLSEANNIDHTFLSVGFGRLSYPCLDPHWPVQGCNQKNSACHSEKGYYGRVGKAWLSRGIFKIEITLICSNLH